jgi:hypothetical protein
MKLHTLTLSYGQEFKATLEISDSCSLYELAELSIMALGFDFDHAFGFYDNPDDPYGSTAKYTLFADMEDTEEDEGLSVKKTKVHQVFSPGTALCFLFDYGDNWQFQITCESIRAASGTKKIRKILQQTGTPPEQYPPLEEEDS